MGLAISHTMRHDLRHEVDHFSHFLSSQGPIATFIHHNTLHGLQHLPFEAAVVEGERLLGGRGYLPNETYRRFYSSGRITDEDIADALQARRELSSGETIARLDQRAIVAEEVYRAHLLYGIDAIEPGPFRCEVLERGATRRFARELPGHTRSLLIERAAGELAATLDRVGRDWTLADWVGYHTNLDLCSALHAEIAASSGSGIAEQPADDWLNKLEIPPERWDGYRRAIDRPDAAGVWLRAEWTLLRRIARRELQSPGTFPAIAQHFERDLEGYAVASLWSACLASYALENPLSAIHPGHLQERDPEGFAEWLDEQSVHMQRWGGPPIALDGELRTAIQELISAELQNLSDRFDRPARPGADDDVPAVEAAHLCWFVLHDLGADELNRRGFGALEALVTSRQHEAAHTKLLERLRARDPRRRMLEHAQAALDDEIAAFGRGRTHADLLEELTGARITEPVNEYLIRRCAAFLDEGLAAWRMPGRALGFYDAWRSLAVSDEVFDLDGLTGWRDALQHLPALAEDAVIEHLYELGVPREHWGEYLGRLLLRLPGWAGMINWRARRPLYPRQQAQPVDLTQYLAVRLFYETALVKKLCRTTWQIDADAESLRHYFGRHLSEFFVRRELARGNLPETLADRARTAMARTFSHSTTDEWDAVADLIWLFRESSGSASAPGHTVYRSAWRLFRLAQFLGLTGNDVRLLTAQDRDRLLGAVDAFPSAAHGAIWLHAYERHYREQTLDALAINRGRGRWKTRDTRPKAQVVFCIDEREEAIHRHVEEIDALYETLGVAGFFGVAMNYSGLGSHERVPLCPPVLAPSHVVHEVPRPQEAHRAATVLRRAKWEEVLHNTYWEIKRNAVAAYFLIDMVGLLQTVPLVGRTLAALAYDKAVQRLRRTVVAPVDTMLTLDAGEGGPTAAQLGFTLDEQVDKVEATLRNIGLTSGFARLIVLLGHGSSSLNNPHESAHDCGACGGKHGGPNARAFAGLANRPGVRARLRARDIDIPDDTWFVGGQHNTCSELLTYFDTQDIPETHRDEWQRLIADLDEARARSAQERCRRFASAPKDAPLARSLRHIESRASDLAQVRPEWGHATNAFAVVGRRSVTQGVFFDRRPFIISYDPTRDGDGKILERILLAVGPVGAGINLEYYFSTVDNVVWGSDTKVPHNVCGLIGVMEGAMSDLRTGLPRQMVEVHEPMRLQLIVEAKPAILGEIHGRQGAIRELLDNSWVHLIALDPHTEQFSRFVPGEGFVVWDRPLSRLPVVKSSFEWYRGKTDFLPPALIEHPRRRDAVEDSRVHHV